MASFSSCQAIIEIRIYTPAMSTSTVSITAKASTNAAAEPRRTKKVVSKPERPRWVTLVLLIVILGLVQMIRKLALKSADSSRVLDFERIVKVESSVKILGNKMQVQAEFVNKKIESEVEGEVNRFEKLSEVLEKLGELGAVEFLNKEDLDKIIDDLMNVKGADNGDMEVTLDDIILTTRYMLLKEIQRLDRVDYALSSGGAMVVRHSEPFIIGKVRRWFRKISLTTVYRDSEKMLKPSFKESDQCFSLKGDSGFVQIRLRTTIIPEAITLEHVDKMMFMLFYVILSNYALLFYDKSNPICLASFVYKLLIYISIEILYTFTIQMILMKYQSYALQVWL